jgi:hypothetical protein
VVSRLRSVLPQRSSLAFPIRSWRGLFGAHGCQCLWSVRMVYTLGRLTGIAGQCLPHCRRNSGTCMAMEEVFVVGCEVLFVVNMSLPVRTRIEK